jgi:hypothetical protein
MNRDEIASLLASFRQRGFGSSYSTWMRPDGETQPIEQLYVGPNHLCDLTVEEGEVRLVFPPSLSSAQTIRVNCDDLLAFIHAMEASLLLGEAANQADEPEA